MRRAAAAEATAESTMAQGLRSHRTSFSRYTSSSSNYCTIFQEKQEARREKGLQLRPSQTIASYRAGADIVGTRQRRVGVPEGFRDILRRRNIYIYI
jgi:hypothetical protein